MPRQVSRTTILKRYKKWLDMQIQLEDHPEYKEHTAVLHDKGFQVVVEMDDNRTANGGDVWRLREEFCIDMGLPYDESIFPEWTSYYELMIALSARAEYSTWDYNEFETEDRGKNRVWWFWTLFDNAGMNDFNGLEEAVYLINTRSYQRNGFGGFYPLERHTEDQRNIELLSQMHAYIHENDL